MSACLDCFSKRLPPWFQSKAQWSIRLKGKLSDSSADIASGVWNAAIICVLGHIKAAVAERPEVLARMVESRTVASILLIAGALLFSSWQRQTAAPVATFVEFRPGLYRLNYQWNIYIGAPISVAAWLIETSPNAWILIDAGTPNADNQKAILQGLQTTLSSADDVLRLVLGQQTCLRCLISFCMLFWPTSAVYAT